MNKIELRDFFAANVASGLVSTDQGYGHYPHVIAQKSYELADALMAERTKYLKDWSQGLEVRRKSNTKK